MPTLQELIEQRSGHGRTIRRLAGEVEGQGRDFTAAERSQWEEANTEFQRLDSRIKVAQRADDVTRELESRRRGVPGTEDTDPRRLRGGKMTAEERDETSATALQGWFRAQQGLELKKSHIRACRRTGLSPSAKGIEFTLPKRPGEQRSLSATVGASGGYTVPTGFVRNLEVALKAYNGVRAVADVMRTDDGADMPWPTANDTGNMGQRIGENTQVATSDPPFGFIKFGAYKYTSNLVLIPNELFEDTPLNMADEVSRMLGERIGRIQELEFTTGTGNAMPTGIASGAAVGATAAGSTSLTGDDIISLIHSVDPVYRA
ncbi:MAG TPA: phage major capsid protein, partial [Urbifossiella sp.]|nr:phage major capsid protein [Urbifossiella sp.]